MLNRRENAQDTDGNRNKNGSKPVQLEEWEEFEPLLQDETIMWKFDYDEQVEDDGEYSEHQDMKL